MSRRALQSRRGVTLVELVVSLVVTGFAVLIGAGGFSNIIDRQQAIETATADVERASAQREMIHTWLAAATISATPPPVVAVGRSAAATAYDPITGELLLNAAVISGDEIRFTTFANNPANAPSAIMRLFIDDDDATPEVGLTVEYRITATSPLGRTQLDPSIGLLTVEFLSSRTQQWVAASLVQGTQPKAVRVYLGPYEDESFSGLLAQPMIVALPAAVAAGAPTATP